MDDAGSSQRAYLTAWFARVNNWSGGTIRGEPTSVISEQGASLVDVGIGRFASLAGSCILAFSTIGNAGSAFITISKEPRKACDASVNRALNAVAICACNAGGS